MPILVDRPPLVFTHCSVPWVPEGFTRVRLAFKQALHLGDMVKSRRARSAREETRKRGGGDFAARSFSRGSLRSPKYSLRSRRLEVVGTRKNERARARSFLHLLHRLAQLGELARRLACSGMLRSRPQAMVNQCWPFYGGTSSYKPLAFYEVSSPPTLLIPLYHLLLFNLNCIVFQD